MTPEVIARRRLARQQYEQRNREKRNAKKRAVRAANPEKTRAENAAFRAANPDYLVEWQRKNPERRQVYRATRRARLAGGEPDLAPAEWQEILDEFDHACAYCQARSVPLEQEHMTPISRGGRHTASNVVPACRSCNARKATKNLWEFAAAS